jgi:hypothetical protein
VSEALFAVSVLLQLVYTIIVCIAACFVYSVAAARRNRLIKIVLSKTSLWSFRAEIQIEASRGDRGARVAALRVTSGTFIVVSFE